MAGISKSGPQYKDKILPADDNFLKTVAVGGGYLEKVRVLCVAAKEAAHLASSATRSGRASLRPGLILISLIGIRIISPPSAVPPFSSQPAG